MNQSLRYEISQVMPTARATGLLKSRASFYAPTEAQGATGNFTGDPEPVAGLQNIPCMDAPESVANPSVNEIKAVAQIQAMGLRHVLLARYYAALTTAAGKGWTCTVDGTLYDLLGAEPDSQRTQTRCRLQVVTI